MTGSEGDGCRSSLKKKKSKEGFMRDMRESEKSLVLHKPLSVCSNVHLPVCLLIQGLVNEINALNYEFRKNLN